MSRRLPAARALPGLFLSGALLTRAILTRAILTRAILARAILARTLLAGLLLAGFFLAGLTACERRSGEPPQPQSAPEAVPDPAVERATLGVWLHGAAILDTGLRQAQTLAKAIQALLDAPDQATLNGARLAWRRSHDAYLAFELYIALGNSNPGLFGSLMEHDFAIEAWPIQPGYLDYFDVYTHSGIVNDVAMPLTAEALRQQHGFTDTSDVSLGFHALEYLLWGENGTRTAGDYQPAVLDGGQSSAGVRVVDLPNNRRRVLIGLLADLLVDDIAAFQQAVENPNGLLRRNYLALRPLSRLALLRQAGETLLTHHRELLRAQLENRLEEGADSGEGLPAELHHSPFAGGGADHLAHSLATVERVLLQTGDGLGLGQWLIEDENQRAEALRALARLRKELLNWNDRPWPPEGGQGGAMLEILSDLAEGFGDYSSSTAAR